MKGPTFQSVNVWAICGVAVAAMGIMTGGVYLGAVRPTLHHAERNRTLQARLIAAQKESSKLAVDLTGQQQKTSQVKQAMQRCEIQLKPAALINQRLQELTVFAQENGMALDAMRPGSPSAGQYYLTVPITLECQCTYPQCALFFHKLVSQFGDMGVRQFQFTGGDEKQHSLGRLKVELIWYTAPNDYSVIHEPGAGLLTEVNEP